MISGYDIHDFIKSLCKELVRFIYDGFKLDTYEDVKINTTYLFANEFLMDVSIVMAYPENEKIYLYALDPDPLNNQLVLVDHLIKWASEKHNVTLSISRFVIQPEFINAFDENNVYNVYDDTKKYISGLLKKVLNKEITFDMAFPRS